MIYIGQTEKYAITGKNIKDKVKILKNNVTSFIVPRLLNEVRKDTTNKTLKIYVTYIKHGLH